MAVRIGSGCCESSVLQRPDLQLPWHSSLSYKGTLPLELMGCFGIPGSVDLIANADFMFYQRKVG